MKKYFIIAASALVAMCACTKTEVTSVNDKISFAPAAYSAQTKAEDNCTTKHKSLDNPFGVYAWYYTAADATAQNFMTNEEVSGEGVTTHDYYWPKTGTVDFVGYYPYGTCWFTPSNTNHVYKYKVEDKQVVSLDNEGKVIDITTTPDLMYADPATQLNANPTSGNHFKSGVPMLFHHALSQLTVRVKQAYKTAGSTSGDNKNTTTWTIKINWINIANIGNTGGFDLQMPVPTESDNVWTLKNGSTSLSYKFEPTTGQELTVPAKDVTTAKIPVFADFENVLLMPQALSSQTIQINYTIKTDRDWTTDSVEETITTDPINFIAATPSIAYWYMGKKYDYVITFAPTDNPTDPSEVKITFDPAVVDWVDGGTETIDK